MDIKLNRIPVKPNATDQEVAEVVNGDQNVQIFAQAAMGNRYAESQRAYREVQQRHEEIKRIERNLVELAQLFNDVRCETFEDAIGGAIN